MSLWIEDLVVKNQFSRPGFKLLGVKAIIMHYTATPGATDENEQDFFDGADGGGSRYAGAHFFIDRDSARLIIPLDEVAYHANEKPSKVPSLRATAPYYKEGNANLLSIGIELCVEKDGTIHADTVTRAVNVATELCRHFKLNPLNDIYRHYDITGKNCPAPWVSNPSLFADFKNRVLQPLVQKPSVIYRAHVQDVGWQGNCVDGQTAGTTGQGKRLEALTICLSGSDASLTFEGHIEKFGWQSARKSGEVIGTMGVGLRLEAIKIHCDKHEIQYRAHVQNYGWMDWKKNGEVAGTTGEGLRIEAIEIKLV